MHNKLNSESDSLNDVIFRLVQSFLKYPPVVIWGSGATVPFGMPSMTDLNAELSKRVSSFDGSKNNLELEIGKSKYKSHLAEIRSIIWEKVKKCDEIYLNQMVSGDQVLSIGVKNIVDKFISAHPKTLNIITTNYDCVLEHIFAYYGIKFTDGFDGREPSSFNENLFANKDIVNIIKVHGSLNWFDGDGTPRFFYGHSKFAPIIVPPGKNKYFETQKIPYRELIQRSDSVIKVAKCFLVIGFGFNDQHLTPEITKRVSRGIPIVLITKEVTDSTFKELKKATKYILIDKKDNHKSRVMFKNGDNAACKEIELEDSYWELNKFINII